MIAVLFNQQEQPPSLISGYTDFLSATAEYIGYGANSSDWTTAQRAELDRHVQEAYQWVLYQGILGLDQFPHTWSWMQRTATMTLIPGNGDYVLPSEYGSPIGQYMFWSDYAQPPSMTGEAEIIHQRMRYPSTGRPKRYAIRWKLTEGYMQRREVIFWPIPSTAWTLTYSYAVNAQRLSETNPWPLGGPRMSQVVMEACKAIGESKKNGQRGDQWGQFVDALRAAITADRAMNTEPTVGILRSTECNDYIPIVRTAPKYYFGPDALGQYVLEA